MYKTLIITIITSLVYFSCEDNLSPIEQPNDNRNILSVNSDSSSYTIEYISTQVKFEIQNRNDSTAYFYSCGSRINFIIQRNVNNIWTNKESWGINSCPGDLSSGIRSILKDSIYYDYIEISEEGTFRIIIPFSYDKTLNLPMSDSLYSNEFVLRKAPITTWTKKQTFTHKQSGQSYYYFPKEKEIIIKFLPNLKLNQLDNFMLRFNLSLKEDKLDLNNCAVFNTSEHDSIIGPIIIKDSLVISALPTYLDNENNDIIVDPAWYIIQFNDSVSIERIENIFTMHGINIVKRQEVGSYIITGALGVRNWCIFNDIKLMMEYPEVNFTEPLYY
jgi:hypothetical protein